MSMLKMKSSSQGYTLIELAISIMIIGLILVGMIGGYNLYMKRQAIITTQDNIKIVVNELQKFKRMYGRLPCPAPLSAPRTDVTGTYGVETDCTDVSITPGTTPADGALGLNGIGIQNSLRTVTPPLPDTPYTPRIRYGAIPFRSMNVPEKASYDGYGSRLYYVLTERMAVRTTMDESQGGITINDLDSPANSVLNPPNSGVFLIFSVGPDKAGGYSQTGIRGAICATGTLDSENCDLGMNAVYRAGLFSGADGNAHFDDTVDYFSNMGDTYWSKNQGTENIIIPKMVGVGTRTPSAALDIANSRHPVNAPNAPEGTLQASGRILADRICPQNTVGTNNNCFEVRNIAGINTGADAGTPAAPGEGMRCPTGQYMSGVEGGKPVCGPASTICPLATQVMTGMNANGTPICTTAPCPAVDYQRCGQTRTWPAASPSGTIVDRVFGTTGEYHLRYRCQSNGNTVAWTYVDEWGVCTCSTDPVTETGVACGGFYTGTCTNVYNVSCPTGARTLASTTCSGSASVNVCAPTCQAPAQTTERRNVVANCPMFKTKINASLPASYDEFVFSVSPGCNFRFDKHVDNCSCQPQPDLDTSTSCPAGHSWAGPGPAGIFQKRVFNTSSCSYDPPTTTTNCSCNSSEEETRDSSPNCQAWETTDVPTKTLFRRSAAGCEWEEISSVPGTCKPRRYTWQITDYGGQSKTPVGVRLGDSCDYTSEHLTGVTKVCYKELGSEYETYSCNCLP